MLGSIKAEFVEEAQTDYVGLWAVLWEVRQKLPSLDVRSAKEATITIVREALEAGHVIAGEFVDMKFVPWNMSVGAAVQRIETAWSALGKEPTIGEVAWFVAPSALAQAGADPSPRAE